MPNKTMLASLALGRGRCVRRTRFRRQDEGDAGRQDGSTPQYRRGKGHRRHRLRSRLQEAELEGDLFRPVGTRHRRAFPRPRRGRTNAGVAVAIPNATASPVEGSATLTDAQAADLVAGKYYINIHTAANPGGEIRGQVMK